MDPHAAPTSTVAAPLASDVVLILGMHRSGTSALTRTLNLLGGRLPANLMPPQADNETGFWESIDVQQLNDRALTALGSRWDDCRPLPLGALDARARELFDDGVAAIVRAENGSAPLLIKDPRICRLLPLWRQALRRCAARACVVVPLRHPWEVAASLSRRNGLALETGLMLWLRHVLDAEHASRGLPRSFASYDALLGDWQTTTGLIVEALQLQLSRPSAETVAAVDAFLQPSLRHHAVANQKALHPWVDAAVRALDDLAANPDGAEAQARLDIVRSELDNAWRLLPPTLQDSPPASIARASGWISARLPPGGREAAALDMTPDIAQRARHTLDASRWAGRFSVIMPTWNRASRLPQAIDSVFAQSYDDWELILCDDGSTDGTIPMLRERYAGALNEGRMHLIEIAHRGVSAARNAALRVATGDWIAYLDSDNTWHADYLLCVAATYALHPHRRSAYAAIHVHDTARDRDFIRWLNFDWERLRRENYIDINVFSHHRSLYETLGGFDEQLRRLEDWDLILRYTRVYPPQRVAHVLCDYYIRPELGNLTLTESLQPADTHVRTRHGDSKAASLLPAPRLDVLIRAGRHDDCVHALRHLAAAGIDLHVYTDKADWDHAALPCELAARAIENDEELAQVLASNAHDAHLWLHTSLEAALHQRDAEWRQRLQVTQRDTQQLRQALSQQKQRLATQEKSSREHVARLDERLRNQQLRMQMLESERARQQASAEADHRRARTRTLDLLRQRRALIEKHCWTGSARLPLPPARAYGMRLSPQRRLRLRAQAKVLVASGLFDSLWYLQTAHDVAMDGGHPVWHWLLRGAAERRSPNPLFDTDWYLRKYPDVVAAGVDPLLHYYEHGAAEGRDPGPLFSSRWYLERNPDVATAGANPLGHYLRFGQREQRAPNDWFDADWYLLHNPDVAKARLPPLEHFLLAGGVEGRSPSDTFDSAWYLATYADVRKSGVNPLKHFLDQGLREGRKPAAAPSSNPAPSRVPAIVAPDSAPARALQFTREHEAAARAQLSRAPVGRFSIVMPTWNRASTICAAIDSVLAQSYADWELLICDDGGTDGTESLVRKRYADAMNAGRVRYLRLPHGGVCAARNAGLNAAQAPWIAYLDSDNTWRPHYLLAMAAALSSEPQRRAAYACLHVRDTASGREFIRCRSYDRAALLARNFIDLNVFVHCRDLSAQLGGFDETLRRLVDWDLILRFTRLHEPLFVPHVLCDYHIGKALNNITLTEPLDKNERAVRRKFAHAIVSDGVQPLRMAYVLWDWPALSQTFVLDELRELRRRNIDVRVYYAIDPDRVATDLPDVPATRVRDADELARLLEADQRNWIHGHFAHLAVRDLVWPAAEQTGIAFSFMAHAIDIFPHRNRRKNRIAEVTGSDLCARVVVHGEFHRQFLIDHGVPAHKIIMSPQAVNTTPIRAGDIVLRQRAGNEPLRVLAIARFVEKKGLDVLIEAAAKLEPGTVEVRIHGYGPLEGRYAARVRELGVGDRVEICGGFEGAEPLRAALRCADLFCLPCIEAEDGDADGMPTTFFEAMSAGVPCLGTTVSAIPDFISDGINGYLVPPQDADALAGAIRRIASMPPEQLTAVAQTAQAWTDEHLGTRHTVDTLLDVCAQPPLDIFMVTYHRDGHGSWTATERAIRSVLERTTTPLLLTIVDNGSDAGFLDRLHTLARGDARIRIVPLGENRMCGPASNIALSLARSEFVFYVCSNEGYIVRNGWERPCLRYMRNHPDVAIGGHLVASPAWPDGRGYAVQPWFKDFRHPEFAEQNPDRAFFHVQGGLYVLRRSVFEKEGGFSERRPQAQTDVEYCHFLESRGYRLGDIPELVVLSNKTRPGIDAFVDETTVAVHPVFDKSLPLVDSLHGDICRCNICGWSGSTERSDDGVSFDCPSCASSPKERAIYRSLAASNLHHRGLPLDARDLGPALRERLADMFTLVDDHTALQASSLPMPRPSKMLGIPPSPSPRP